MIGLLNQLRRAATRCESTAASFPSFDHISAIYRWMRLVHVGHRGVINIPIL
ncbi:MAG: hypothetical protein ACI9ZM_000391 [Paracoccaceae bacterium]|jgi:hypothetical protein